MSDLSPLEELTLLLLEAPSRKSGGRDPIPGRTHLAKELFLLWKSPVFASQLKSVRFEPGRFGPWTEAISVAMDELVSRDLVSVSTGKASVIRLTAGGAKTAEKLWITLSPERRAVLTDVKSNLNPLSTEGLLDRIYSAYPEYAVSSEWTGSRTPK